MKLPKLGRIGTAIVLFVALSAAGTAIALQASSTSSPAKTHKKAATSAHKVATSSAPAAHLTTEKTSTNCLNSFTSSCGDFYWDPTPGSNADLTVTLSTSAISATAGQPLSFTATADDPDASIVCDNVYYGEGVNIGNAVRLNRQYGRWEPPAKTHGTQTKSYTHTFEQPGTYHVVVTFTSGDNCSANYNPYASTGSAALAVTVH